MTHNSTHRACRDRFQTLQFYEEALTFMAFCANCGAQMEGRFCAKCGATAPAAATTGGAVPVASAAPAAQSAGMAENVASALCYALGLITGVIFLILEPYNNKR